MSREIKSDFVNVRLTHAGVGFAGEHGVVHVANAHMAYTFAGQEPQRVVMYQWRGTLSRELVAGQPMFEIVEAQSGPQSGAPAKEEESNNA
jgi:hypothetical protein